MREVKHVFATNAEANAFVIGVEWVNDSAIEAIDILVGTDDRGPRSAVLCNDEEGGDEDIEFDHRDEEHPWRLNRDRERAGNGLREFGTTGPCVCVVTREKDGALCLCAVEALGVCSKCDRSQHIFDGSGVRSFP